MARNVDRDNTTGRDWDWSNTWEDDNQSIATWEMQGVTGLPPEVCQSFLGRLPAIPLQYQFRLVDLKDRPNRKEYDMI